MPDSDATHVGGIKVFNPAHLRRWTGLTAAVSTSESLEDFFGAPLPVGIGGVLVNNLSIQALRYQNDGTDATATTSTIDGAEVQFFEGSKAELDDMRIFAAPSANVSITQFITR